MNTSLYIASTGLRAYQGKLDTIANNIANSETTGFKRREATFSENLAVSIQNQAEPQKEEGRLSPPGIRTTFGSRIGATPLDNTAGAPQETSNPYDLMIEGNGYFQVQRTTENGNEVYYTRNGAFKLSPVGNGISGIVNSQGDLLLDNKGNPVVLPNGTDFRVLPDGTVEGTNQQIGIFSIENPQALKDEGGVYRLPNGNGTLSNSFNLKQGFLESSNVDLSQELTDMMKAQRGLQANARAVTYADQMLGIANGIIRS